MGSGFVLVIVVGLFIDVLHGTVTPEKPLSYTKKGHIMLGGLFPLHYSSYRPDNYSLLSKPAEKLCERYNFLGFRWMQAMVFAVDQINARLDILQNYTLGFHIFDTCNTRSRALAQSHYMVKDLENSRNTSISAVIGPTESNKATLTSNILSLFDVPQISYGSTSRLLSDKKIYNSFFRTIPNDDEQTLAIVDLLVRHNWTWIGAIAGDDEYGRPGITKLKEKAKEHHICIEYTGYVSENMPDKDVQRLAENVRDFNATVFVMFISAAYLKPLVKELSRLNVTDKVWIASEAWATSDTIRKVDEKFMQGTLGIATRGGAMKGFRSYLQSLSPQSQQENPFVREFWENTFDCFCPSCHGPENNHTLNSTHRVCNGSEELKDEDTAFLNWNGNELEKGYNVYMAVHVVAHALEDILKCEPGFGNLQNGACPHIDRLEPWQLLAYIRHVNFTPPDQDEPFYFDDSGDPLASYKLVSWVPKNKSATNPGITFKHVGNYSTMKTPSWSIDYDNIYWKLDAKEIPISLCNPPCPPGTYQSSLSSTCCYECRKCSIYEYSVENNSGVCLKCGEHMRANANRTACVDKLREYVRWDDWFGITFCCFVGLGLVITTFVFCVFYKKKNSPLVKATNVELSFLLLFSLACCFLTPLFYIAEPQDWSCRARMVSFSLSFTFSVAAVLVKTLRVLTAFNARVPFRHNMKSRWMGEHLQIVVVFLVTLLQGIFCLAWLLSDPPEMIIVPSVISNDSLSIQCSSGSIGLMGSVYAYLSLLAIVAFVFAFRARKLPENFNEAKFITFSMLVFLIVWLSFVPAYISTTGSMTTVVNCIAILASTFGFIACIFFPKLYVIFVTPSRNTIEELRSNNARHTFRNARLHTSTRTSASPEITSPKMVTERRENFRKKYLETYNSLSLTENSKFDLSPKMIRSVHKDRTIDLGVGEYNLSSSTEQDMDKPHNGTLINLNLKVNIRSPTETKCKRKSTTASSESIANEYDGDTNTSRDARGDGISTDNKPFANGVKLTDCEAVLNNTSSA